MDIYAEHILDLYKHPAHRGPLPGATHTASGANLSCGDRVRMYLKITDGIVTELSYEGEGCVVCLATASLLTELLIGKTAPVIRSLNIEDLEQALGTPLGHLRAKCAFLPLETVQSALSPIQE